MSDTTFILWVRQFATPALTSFFAAVTSLGSLEFYMLAIPVIYWIVNKRFGFRFTIFFIFSAYINSGTKYIFATERPPRELRLVTQEGYSFPSGHAQGSTVFWGFLALKFKERWAWWLSGIMIALISFSRIYLGVHWPIDILGGLAIGFALLFLYSRYAPENLEEIPMKKWCLGALAISVILYLIHPTGDGPMSVGFLLGALLGYRLELIYVDFPEKASPIQNVLKLILGLVVLFLLRIVLKPVVAWIPGNLSIVVRYALLGFWATLGAPFAFVKLGLFSKPTQTQTQTM